MSSAPCPDEAAEYRLTALPGNRAAYVLATWGLVSLLPGATLRFEGEGVPVVGYGGHTDELVKVAARGLVERTWGLGERGLRGIVTTTPTRSAVNVLSHAVWQAADKTSDLRTSGPVAVFDASATSAERLKSTGMQDLQVRSSALTLLSGKSHTAKSVQDTWGLMGASLTTADDAVAAGVAHLDRLVHGDLAVARAKPGLRFSASQAWISWPSAGTCSSSRSSVRWREKVRPRPSPGCCIRFPSLWRRSSICTSPRRLTCRGAGGHPSFAEPDPQPR